MTLAETDIRWTDRTWNPVHGCSKTSEGCKNCYAERVSHRFEHTETAWTVDNAAENVQLKQHFLDERLNEPAWVFINSMSDLYHQEVPDQFIAGVFDACLDMPRSAFQILSKHGPDQERSGLHPPDNIMLGVSVETPRRRYRIEWLRNQPAATRFVSFEPLVEGISDVDLDGIDWAIIGGESGPDHRPMEPGWARSLVRQCHEQGVAVFFKQHSGQYPEEDTRLLIGGLRRRIEEFPRLPHGVAPVPRAFCEGVTA